MRVFLLDGSDVKKLTICGMEKSDSKRQIGAHDPEFGVAGKERKNGIEGHDHCAVQMQRGDGRKHQWQPSHLQIW